MSTTKQSAPAIPAGRRFIVLAEGQAPGQMVPVIAKPGASLSGLFLHADKPLPVVTDDSPETGVSVTLAESLTDRGICVYLTDSAAKRMAGIEDIDTEAAETPDRPPIATEPAPVVAP